MSVSEIKHSGQWRHRGVSCTNLQLCKSEIVLKSKKNELSLWYQRINMESTEEVSYITNLIYLCKCIMQISSTARDYNKREHTQHTIE